MSGGIKKVVQEFEIVFQWHLALFPMLVKEFFSLFLEFRPYLRKALNILFDCYDIVKKECMLKGNLLGNLARWFF